MILIVESGSSKTDWVIIDNDIKLIEYQTIGLNPYHIKDWNEIKRELTMMFSSYIKDIDKIYFYGSGCGREEADFIIKTELSEVFVNSSFEIYNDLIAACRATAGKNNEIVAILGTGSNSCLYIDEEIKENIAATGYLFADEGGGVDLGKRFIGKVLRKELSENIINQFYTEYNLSYEKLIKNCYSSSTPNKYLASFTPFLLKNIKNENIHQLVLDSYTSLFKNQITKYSDYNKFSISFVGSIAFYFQDVLREVADSFNIKIHLIIKQPIENLITYHRIKKT